MKQYRCNNCDNTWESQDEPFECPKCHSASIMEVAGKTSIMDNIKKYWWILACAVVAALAFILIMPKNATRVKVKADSTIGRMEIKLKGKHATEYLVIVKQNEIIEKQAKTKDENPVIFNDLKGDYILELMYIGEGKAPKIRKYQKEYTFNSEFVIPPVDSTGLLDDGPIPPTPRPEIVSIVPSPKRIAEGGSYTVKVNLSPYGCPESEAEFSMNGTDWQSSPTFTNLAPEEYKFYARNKNMKDLMSDMEIVLPEAHSKECLSVGKANSLLQGIAKSDRNAIDTFYKYASRNTVVKGVEEISSTYSLVVTIREEEQVNYTITNVECSNGNVQSITIKHK